MKGGEIMRRDLFHYFEADVKNIYAAYLKAAKEKFGKDCSATPYHSVSFGLNFSFKYNMNGGACHIHFIPYKSGTAVGLRYTIVQLFGARYEAHDSDMLSYVEREVGTKAKSINIDMAVFLKDSNQVFDNSLKSSNETAKIQVKESISNADELRKFKELLDAGIITQEEFEAKKKHLLGL